MSSHDSDFRTNFSCNLNTGRRINFTFGSEEITGFTNASEWWRSRGPWPVPNDPTLVVKAGVVERDGDSVIDGEEEESPLGRERRALVLLWGPPNGWIQSRPAPGTPAASPLEGFSSVPAAVGAYAQATCVGDLMTPPRGAFDDVAGTLSGVGGVRVSGIVFEREARDVRDIATYDLGGVEDPDRLRLARAFALTHLAVLPLLHKRSMIAGDVRLQNTLLPRSQTDWQVRGLPPLLRLSDFSHATFLDPDGRTGAASPATVATKYLTPPGRSKYVLRGPYNDWYAFAVSLYELLFDGELPFALAHDRGRPLCADGQIPSGTALARRDDRNFIAPGVRLGTEIAKGEVIVRRREYPGAPELNELIALLVTGSAVELDIGVRRLLELTPGYFIQRIFQAIEDDSSTRSQPPLPPVPTMPSVEEEHSAVLRRGWAMLARQRSVSHLDAVQGGQSTLRKNMRQGPDDPAQAGRLQARRGKNAHTVEVGARARRAAAAVAVTAESQFSEPSARSDRPDNGPLLQQTTLESFFYLVGFLFYLVGRVLPPLLCVLVSLGLSSRLLSTHDWTAHLNEVEEVGLLLAPLLLTILVIAGELALQRPTIGQRVVSNCVCCALLPPVVSGSGLAAEAAFHQLYPNAAWLEQDWGGTQRFLEVAFIAGTSITILAASGTGRAASAALATWIRVPSWMAIAVPVAATLVTLTAGATWFEHSASNNPLLGSDDLSCVSPVTFAIATDRVCVSGSTFWTVRARPTAAELAGADRPVANTLTFTDRAQPCVTATLDYYSYNQTITPAQLRVPPFTGTTLTTDDRNQNTLPGQPQIVAGRKWRYDRYSETSDHRTTSATRYWTSAPDNPTTTSLTGPTSPFTPSPSSSATAGTAPKPSSSMGSSTTVTLDVNERSCASTRATTDQRDTAVRALLNAVQVRSSNCIDAASFQSLNGGTSLAVARAASAVCIPLDLGLVPDRPDARYTDTAFLSTVGDLNWFAYIYAGSTQSCAGKPVRNGFVVDYRSMTKTTTFYCRVFVARGQRATLFVSDGAKPGDAPQIDALISRGLATISTRT